MEKEMKKLLLVAVSVGVFLLVTVTAAIVILTPRGNTGETAFSSSHPFSTGRIPVVETVRETQPQAVQETTVSIIREDSNVTAVVDKNDGNSLTINIPKPSTAAVPDNPKTQASPRQTAVVTPAPKPSAAQKTTPAARPAPAKTSNDYWVQTGAFTARIRAEDAKDTLASKGITSIIENRIVDGRTWYRVRLGPYTSEKEANYWLALVKTINGFSESQVRQTIRQQ